MRDRKPSLVISILQNKCPRCRRGKMYKNDNPYNLKTYMKMNERCPVCNQPLDMEPGFYYGTNMVSYALAVLISMSHIYPVVFPDWFFIPGQTLFLVDGH